MEIWTDKLDVITGKIRNLLDAYIDVKSENESLKNEINHLKVEIVQFEEQLNYINSEQINAVETVSTLSTKTSDISTPNPDLTQKNKEHSDGMKTKLDEIIEELDQCIQIIQSNSYGSK